MLLNVLLSGILAAVTILMGYLGVHVTLHPTESKTKQRSYKIGFLLCAVISVFLVVCQAVRNAHSQASLQSELSQLHNQVAHTHIRLQITSIAINEPSLVGKPTALSEIYSVNRKAMFNVEYRNTGNSNSERTGAVGDILITDTRPDLATAFSKLEERFKPGWTGDELVPQEPKFFTAESHSLSRVEIAGLTKGSTGLFLIGIVRFSDTTGNYQQEFCSWLQPPGNAPVWHGCGEHESEIKLK